MSDGQLYFEDVEVGALLPALTRGPFTIKDLVKFGAATNDYSEIHFDEGSARARGLPGPVIHGPFKSALLAQMLNRWAGPEGTLKRFSCQYRRMDVVGETLTCQGKVTGKSIRDGKATIECEVWTENSKGEITTRGNAAAVLPTRQTARGNQPSKDAALAADLSQISLITDQMRRDLKLRKVAGVSTYKVDRKWISQFATAFGDPNPLWHDEHYARTEGRFDGMTAPPTFFAALDPVERKELSLDEWVETIPYKNTGGGVAFSEVEYFMPIQVDQAVTVEVSYTDIHERDGRSGRLLFRIRETLLQNERGAVIARARIGHVRSYDLSRKRAE